MADQHPIIYYRSQGKSGMGGNQYPVPSTMATIPSREDQEDEMFDEILVPYRNCGLTDPDDIRDLALVMGGPAMAEAVGAALVESEARSISVAMVQCDPPGKNTAGFLRSLAQRFSRVLVGLYPGSLRYPSMIEALRMSLPDVDGKIQFLPIGRPSLAELLTSAQVRHGHAIEVHAPQDLVQPLTSEKDGGGLSVDPTVIRIVPTDFQPDDSDAIRNSMSQPTAMSAKALLDPHVFSDPRGMDRMRRALDEARRPRYFGQEEYVQYGEDGRTYEFNVDSIGKWMVANCPLKAIQISQIDTSSMERAKRSSDWVERADEADTIYPVLLLDDSAGSGGFIPSDPPEPGKLRIIDGYHRIAKLAAAGKTFVKARVIDTETVVQLVNQKALGESLRLEFLADISPKRDREDGATRILQIVDAHRGLLSQRGVQTEGMKFLGKGNNGLAWELADKRVLKVTTDDAEAAVAVHLKGQNFKHIFQVHDAWAFPGKYEGHHVYGLVTEAGLVKPSLAERTAFARMISILTGDPQNQWADRDDVKRDQLESGDLRPLLQSMMAERSLPPQFKRDALNYVKRFDLPGICADAKRLGVAFDLHPGNIMKRPDGTFVVIDIGTGGDQEAAKPPFLERRLSETGILSAPQNGGPRGGPLGRGGNNSSSWSSGRMALRQPNDFVPIDDNEQGQIPLDTQYGVKLPQPEEFEDEFGRKS